MGKPRMIILVRHAQSEGNKNRDIHQYIPDHRVKLTPDGWQQAEDAGRRLRSMLKPDDTLQICTSPYRRTRETTEGILRELTSDETSPSPFPRHKIKVYEEPRLREQDFGNFQPCSAEMERMWQERADYGHFFYRIPNGESAADAYDRISGFNEGLWRQFQESDFPSVCVLVTHGLMTRVFLMRWFHWSVEYFEDLRNIHHCEFIIMKQNMDNGKYILQNELRTWSVLKKQAAALNPSGDNQNELGNKKGSFATAPQATRRWGGCANGCNHAQQAMPRRIMRKNTADFLGTTPTVAEEKEGEEESPKLPHHVTSPTRRTHNSKNVLLSLPNSAIPKTGSSSVDQTAQVKTPTDSSPSSPTAEHVFHAMPTRRSTVAGILRQFHQGRDPRKTTNGNASPHSSDDSDDAFPENIPFSTDSIIPSEYSNNDEATSDWLSQLPLDEDNVDSANPVPSVSPKSPINRIKTIPKESKDQSKERPSALRFSARETEWQAESGMGSGALADTLGDGKEDSTSENDDNIDSNEDSKIEAEKLKDRASLSEVY